MIVAGTEAKADQGPRVRDFFRLPSVIGLIAAHRVFAGLIPGSRRLTSHIVFADQGFLNGLRSLGINFLLAARFFLAVLA